LPELDTIGRAAGIEHYEKKPRPGDRRLWSTLTSVLGRRGRGKCPRSIYHLSPGANDISSFLLRAGKAVQRALGHRQITTTEIYARVGDDALRHAVSGVG